MQQFKTMDEYEEKEQLKNIIHLPTIKKVGTIADEIEESEVEWLWKKRLPQGKLVLIVGVPKVGKTFLTTFLMAHVTNGRVWPDGSTCEQGSCIVISPEDNASDTLIPRLKDAGANLSNILLLKTAIEDKPKSGGNSGEVRFSIPEHLDALINGIRYMSHKAPCRMIILDTIEACTSLDINSKKIKEQFVFPLVDIAEKENVTIVCVTHLKPGAYHVDNIESKINGHASINRTSRLTYLVAPDEINKGVIVVKEIKSNIGKIDPFCYRIVENLNHQVFVEMISGDNISSDEKSENFRMSILAKEMLAYMRYQQLEHGITEFTPIGLAQQTGINHNTVKNTLVRLLNEKQISRYAYGIYGLSDRKSISETEVLSTEEKAIQETEGEKITIDENSEMVSVSPKLEESQESQESQES